MADNGIGIDPQYYERIFVIFQRLHARDEYPGTGIGLAQTYQILQWHYGSVDFETEEGQGTTFRLRLPLVQSRSVTLQEATTQS